MGRKTNDRRLGKAFGGAQITEAGPRNVHARAHRAPPPRERFPAEEPTLTSERAALSRPDRGRLWRRDAGCSPLSASPTLRPGTGSGPRSPATQLSKAHRNGFIGQITGGREPAVGPPVPARMEGSLVEEAWLEMLGEAPGARALGLVSEAPGGSLGQASGRSGTRHRIHDLPPPPWGFSPQLTAVPVIQFKF